MLLHHILWTFDLLTRGGMSTTTVQRDSPRNSHQRFTQIFKGNFQRVESFVFLFLTAGVLCVCVRVCASAATGKCFMERTLFIRFILWHRPVDFHSARTYCVLHADCIFFSKKTMKIHGFLLHTFSPLLLSSSCTRRCWCCWYRVSVDCTQQASLLLFSIMEEEKYIEINQNTNRYCAIHTQTHTLTYYCCC